MREGGGVGTRFEDELAVAVAGETSALDGVDVCGWLETLRNGLKNHDEASFEPNVGRFPWLSPPFSRLSSDLVVSSDLPERIDDDGELLRIIADEPIFLSFSSSGGSSINIFLGLSSMGAILGVSVEVRCST